MVMIRATKLLKKSIFLLIISIGFINNSATSDQIVNANDGLANERKKALDFLEGKNTTDSITFCTPFISYGRYFLNKKNEGVPFEETMLRLKYLSASTQQRIEDKKPGHGLIDMMLNFGNEIHNSQSVNKLNIDLASQLYCESIKSILLTKTGNDDV